MFYVRVLMEWTTEKPTVEGWYWVWDGKEINMAHVSIYKIQESVQIQIWIEDVWYEIGAFTHFIGPLPEPEPPHAPN